MQGHVWGSRSYRLLSRILAMLVALTLLPLFGTLPVAAQEDEDEDQARVRVVHAIPDAGAVDVYLNGKRALAGVQFFTVSDYLAVEPGDYRVQVVPAGVRPSHRTALIEDRLHLNEGNDYSVIARGTVERRDVRAVRSQLLKDRNSAPEGDAARVRVAHFAPNAPAVDIFVNGERVIRGLRYRFTSDYLTVPAGTYTIGVAPANREVIYTTQLTLGAGQVATAWANGLLGGSGDQAFEVTPSIDATFTPTARLRAVHAVPDIAGSPVDVYVNGDKVVTFDFFDATDYLTVPAGEYDIRVVLAGGNPQTDAVISAVVTLAAGKDYSAVASGTANPSDAAPLGATLLEDDNSDPQRGRVRVRVAHFSPDAPAVDIFVNDQRAIENLSFTNTTGYVTLRPGTYKVGVAPAGGDPLFTTELTVDAGETITAWANGLLSGSGDQAFTVTPTIDATTNAESLANTEE